MNLDMMKWDAMKLPFSDNSVDVFVTDLVGISPFSSARRSLHNLFTRLPF